MSRTSLSPVLTFGADVERGDSSPQPEALVDDERRVANVAGDTLTRTVYEPHSAEEGLRRRGVPSLTESGSPASTPHQHYLFDIPRKWTSYEDALITERREVQNMNWEDISRELPGRDPTSCRLRYQKHLEGRWTTEEDALLKELRERKNMQWEEISKQLPRHSPDSCRLRYQHGFHGASLYHGFRF